MSDETTIETWDRIADEFLRRRTRTLIEKRWLDRMVGVAPADDGPRRLLDLGCGTGLPLATYLSDRGLRLPRAEAHQVDMRDLALGRPFDALLAWDSLLHLTPEEQRKMVPVFRRHAATGAALMFTTSAQPGETWKEAVAGAPVYHAALDPAEYRALLDENRFRLVDVRAEDPDCTDHSVWLARFTGE